MPQRRGDDRGAALLVTVVREPFGEVPYVTRVLIGADLWGGNESDGCGRHDELSAPHGIVLRNGRYAYLPTYAVQKSFRSADSRVAHATRRLGHPALRYPQLTGQIQLRPAAPAHNRSKRLWKAVTVHIRR